MKNFQFVFFPLCFSINKTNNQRTLPPLSISLFLSLSLSLSVAREKKKEFLLVAAEKERKNKAMMKNEEIAKKTSKRVESFFAPLLGFWCQTYLNAKFRTAFNAKRWEKSTSVLSSLISLVFLSRSVRQHFLRRNNTITHTLYKTPTNARITNTLRVLIHNITINTFT